jgi:hypothetical protein
VAKDTTAKRTGKDESAEGHGATQHGRAATVPTASAELALIGAAVSGGKLTFDIALKVVEHLKTKRPLAAQVLDSRKVNSNAVVYLRLTNLSGHGLCVSAIVSTRPTVTQPGVQRLVLAELGAPMSTKRILPQDPALPFVIPPTESQDVRLLFDLAATRKEIYNALHGKVRIDFEVLGDTDTDQLGVPFRFREDAPVESSFAAYKIPRS